MNCKKRRQKLQLISQNRKSSKTQNPRRGKTIRIGGFFIHIYRGTTGQMHRNRGNYRETARKLAGGNCKAAGGCTTEAVCVKGTVQKLPATRGKLHGRPSFAARSASSKEPPPGSPTRKLPRQVAQIDAHGVFMISPFWIPRRQKRGHALYKAEKRETVQKYRKRNGLFVYSPESSVFRYFYLDIHSVCGTI